MSSRTICILLCEKVKDQFGLQLMEGQSWLPNFLISLSPFQLTTFGRAFSEPKSVLASAVPQLSVPVTGGALPIWPEMPGVDYLPTLPASSRYLTRPPDQLH